MLQQRYHPGKGAMKKLERGITGEEAEEQRHGNVPEHRQSVEQQKFQ